MEKRIGIRREDRSPWERRVPLIPEHVKELSEAHGIKTWVQPSEIRVFPDKDYLWVGAKIEENICPCPIVFAVKEIPVHLIEHGKVYIFFSHTTKGQKHNMPMLKKMIDEKCTLIDYEKIVDEKGQRLVFFGIQAGQAGMVDSLWAYGQKLKIEGIETQFSTLRQAYTYLSLKEAKEKIKKIGKSINDEGLHASITPFICGFLGYGHVSKGAQEIFELMPYEEISPEELSDFIKNKEFSARKVYKVVFKEHHIVKPRIPGETFNLQDYYERPEKYTPVFESYIPFLSIIMNCIYWSPKYPRFITKKFLKQYWNTVFSPKLKVIGDISCDINGSVECTFKATTPDVPVFTYDPVADKSTDGFEGPGVVIMAIDNLPAEIPLESSIFFSKILKRYIPEVAKADYTGSLEDCNLPPEIKKAVILYKGQFTPDYIYMKKFIENLSKRGEK
ncbi:MAG: bifunctional lysine ketoglutarate reductase /saccharopine dehydrogenase family protein [Acidobacteriota bacterium]|nr:bifunctional lysine ketoglutarate reductase /saccharopine dehydrogenase family protein [Acidobacteriota bacterium]